ncbi:hypothetical protein CYMTET_42501 [Cymbomonas tetramitiformis]|uniref:EGF-like domain-containing protein n=1 Tax=Cymbomonas tetramitiformis TaxID=36881 RepID=A0AAE0F1G4_9CHLO|nr:hypothetical protein CYMTET_42501 [Cymbomonas tetramitiformis]
MQQGRAMWLFIFFTAAILHSKEAVVDQPCPGQCSRQGVCSNGACRCYREFQGADCSSVRYLAERPPTPLPVPEAGALGLNVEDSLPGESEQSLRVAVVSCQVLQSSLDDDMDVIIPAAALVRALALAGHQVTLLFFLEVETEGMTREAKYAPASNAS